VEERRSHTMVGLDWKRKRALGMATEVLRQAGDDDSMEEREKQRRMQRIRSREQWVAEDIVKEQRS